MKPKVLFVDDEANILEACQRALRRAFDIATALGGELGLKAIAERGPYAVIVSDMRMPGMDGIQFLSKVKELAPTSVRMMLTGNADQQTAIDAVNEGSIFRFLNKPCSPERLKQAVDAALEQHRLIMAEKELLQNTLQGGVRLLTDVLAMVNPTAFGRSTRLRPVVKEIAAQLRMKDAWQAEIATMLCQVGCVTVPEETLSKVYNGGSLSPDELEEFQDHPRVGYDLIVRIPRLEAIAEIIKYQEKRYDGSGIPAEDIQGQKIPLGSRVLKLALDFDSLIASGMPRLDAYKKIDGRTGWYDPQCLEALKTVLAGEVEYELQCVEVSNLTDTMLLAEEVTTSRTEGLLKIPQGHELTPYLRVRLQNLARNKMIPHQIKVLVPV